MFNIPDKTYRGAITRAGSRNFKTVTDPWGLTGFNAFDPKGLSYISLAPVPLFIKPERGLPIYPAQYN